MALSALEQAYMNRVTEAYAPTPEPEPEALIGQTDAAMATPKPPEEPKPQPSGVAEMKPYDPTVRQQLSDFLRAGFEGIGIDRAKARSNAEALIGGPNSPLPLEIGIADFIPFLGTGLQTQEAYRMGGEAIESAKRGELGTAALQAGGAALGLIPGAAGTYKYGKPIVEDLATKAKAGELPVGLSVQPVTEAQAAEMLAAKGVQQPVKQQASKSGLGFYSAVEDAALNLQRNSGSGQAFLNDIKKGANVKDEEIKWLGLDEFLRGKKNVTKQEVQDYVANNKVDVKEVRLADVKPAAVSTEKITDYFDKALTPNGDEAQNIFQFSFTEKGAREPTNFTAYEMRSGTVELYDNRGNFIDEYGTLEGARNHVWNESQFAANQAEDATKFGQYTLPGGKNYRELLLTMPSKETPKTVKIEFKSERDVEDFLTDMSAEGYENLDYGRIDGTNIVEFKSGITYEINNLINKNQGYGLEDQDLSKSFRSSHWDEPNVLAHLRVNDRVDADGKKMLLVEEVQSDWHQAGRDKGYATADINTRLKESEKELKQIGLQIRGLNNRMAGLSDADIDEFNKLADERQKLFDRQGVLMDEGNALIDRRNAGVPDAPFKDTWYQLALKRALQYAAENGYDRVGLTTGARQAERYDLSKQVEYIDYRKSADGTFELGVADIHGDAVNLPKTRFTAEELPSVVGKEIADKIIKGEGQGGGGRMTLRGIDLKVGGEGMKKYYDEVYPQFLAKYGKKWDAKVGETSINLNKDLEGFMPRKDMQIESVRYIDITPKMRESVTSKGQPLFTAAPIATGAGSATIGQDGETDGN